MVVCKKCKHEFDGNNHVVTAGGAAAGATAGAWFGSGIGLAMGPLGAIAGTVPGAVIGGLLGGLGISKFVKCPSCTNVFMK